MTNRERYRRTFEALHVSDERLREVYFMENNKKTMRVGRFLLVAACMVALLTVSAFAANEATDGVLFHNISIFIDGVKGNVAHNSDGSYTVTTEDGRQIAFTVDEFRDGEVTTEDGDVYYASSYEFTFDGDDYRQFEMQIEDMLGEG